MGSQTTGKGAGPTGVEPSVPVQVLERVSDACIAIDREWRYVYANPSAVRLLQRPASELLGRCMWDLFPADKGGAFHRAGLHAMETQECITLESRPPSWGRWFESRIYPSPDGLSVLFRDITESKRTRELLAGQSHILELITHGAPMVDSLEALLRMIEAQCPGMRSSILMVEEGVRLRHLCAPSLSVNFTRPLDGVLIGPEVGSCGAAAYLRQPVISRDIGGDPKWAAWREAALAEGLRACWSTPILDDQQQVLGTFAMYYGEPAVPSHSDQCVVELATHIAAIAIGRERAEREREEQERIRQQNRELEEANRAMDAANRLKSEFLANMSHELRTPLNAVLGFSEYMLDEHAGPLTTKQTECLQHVLAGGRHLLRLVSDVLDLAKVEAGKIELFPDEFDLRALLKEVCALVGGLANDKQIELRVRCDPKLGVVTLDPQKLKQVLFNLLANAVKFTGEGGKVELHARCLEPDQLEVRVRDTGIGIRREDLPKLFHEFQQLDSGVARRHAGTGLGLALAKRLVESQGGTIGVESEYGVGSTFSVVLPRVFNAQDDASSRR